MSDKLYINLFTGFVAVIFGLIVLWVHATDKDVRQFKSELVQTSNRLAAAEYKIKSLERIVEPIGYTLLKVGRRVDALLALEAVDWNYSIITNFIPRTNGVETK